MHRCFLSLGELSDEKELSRDNSQTDDQTHEKIIDLLIHTCHNLKSFFELHYL